MQVGRDILSRNLAKEPKMRRDGKRCRSALHLHARIQHIDFGQHLRPMHPNGGGLTATR